MLALGIVASFGVVGFLCWTLFQLANFALPTFVGVSAGLALYHAGLGPISSIGGGLLAGAAVLVAGQLAFSGVRSIPVRLALAGLFVLPAAVAGYHAVHGMMGLGDPAEIWRQLAGGIGAVMVGAAAFSRLTLNPRTQATTAATLRREIRADDVRSVA